MYIEILDNFLLEDKIYQKDIEDMNRLRQRYESLELSLKQIDVIEDYIVCLETALDRKCEIALKVGKLLGEISLENAISFRHI